MYILEEIGLFLFPCRVPPTNPIKKEHEKTNSDLRNNIKRQTMESGS